ncbi:MAG: hypothetical protein K6U79_10460 [Firmicutes bacterium]|nr:hypothetical protein [Bacillota bacterium]
MSGMGERPPDPRLVRELERRLEEGEVPPWLHARLMAAIRREELRRERRRRWHEPRRALAAAAAVALLALAAASSPMLRDRLAGLAGGGAPGGAAAGGGARPQAAPTAEALLPRSGRYATLAGAPVEWQVRRAGATLQLTEVLPAVPASARPARRSYRLELRDGCLEAQGAGGAASSWYCLPAAGKAEVADGGQGGAALPAGESWVQDPDFGRVLRVVRPAAAGEAGGAAVQVERFFAPGSGLVRELWLDARGRLLDERVRLGGPAAERPLVARLPLIPFGAPAEEVSYRLVTPAGLPFSLYVPADSRWVPGGFQVEPVEVGEARGIRYGLLDRNRMVTEVVFLPPGATLEETVANMLQAMVDFRRPPYGLIFQESPAGGSAPWVLRSYQGSNRSDPTMTGLATVSRYGDRYFYLIRVGWYEQPAVADLQSWQWQDGKGFQQGLAGEGAGAGSAP